jgi:hypothetical protein
VECLLDRISGDDPDAIVSERKDKNRTASVECLLDTSIVTSNVDNNSEHSDLRFKIPSNPPGPPVIDLQGNQESSAKHGSREQYGHETQSSSCKYVSIQTSTPNVKFNLVKSSQVLHTFRTWLDGEETETQGCQTFSSELNTKTFTNVNQNGAINSVDGSNTDSHSELMSQFDHDGIRTSVQTFKCMSSAPVSCNVFVTKDTNATHVVPTVLRGDELASSAGEKQCSSDDSSMDVAELADTKVSDTSPIRREVTGASKNDGVSNFESPALEQLDIKTSAYLNAIQSFKNDEGVAVTSATRLISKLNKNRDNHLKLRRVQSMKETSPRRVEKRRVDWGPCVQIHYYDPESEIDSSEDHICRTTAMDFANTLEYEGSLV